MSAETLVFVVRRYGVISDSWSAHPGKTFDEVIEFATNKVRDGGNGTAFDVVEVTITRQSNVRARIEAVEVTS